MKAKQIAPPRLQVTKTDLLLVYASLSRCILMEPNNLQWMDADCESTEAFFFCEHGTSYQERAGRSAENTVQF